VLIKQLVIELKNKCSGLHSPSGPPNSGGVATGNDRKEEELTIPILSPAQWRSVVNIMGLLFFKDIVIYF
jgi:hypothetical protein